MVSQFLYRLKRLQKVSKKESKHADREKTHGKNIVRKEEEERQTDIESNKQRSNTH